MKAESNGYSIYGKFWGSYTVLDYTKMAYQIVIEFTYTYTPRTHGDHTHKQTYLRVYSRDNTAPVTEKYLTLDLLWAVQF